MPNLFMAAKSEPISGKRLDSWKEIAACLGRAERTVKRWETERGLPVHRVPGGGRSAVFAYTNELADWLKGPGQGLDSASVEIEEERTASAAAQPTQTPPTVVPPSEIKRWPASRLAAWLVPLLLAAALVTAFTTAHSPFRFKSRNSSSSAKAESLELSPDSVAVMPFTNIRGNADTDYLSDGLSESLISSLARIGQLKVRSRDTAFRYKGKDIDIETIGSNLRVSKVVSGRVLAQGDVIDLSAEITDIRDNTEIWGHHYLGKRADLISLQQQLAGDIAEKLRTTLSSADKMAVIREGTQNTEAYALYLRGRYAWNQRGLANLKSSISFFNQAIAKDPEYALAWSGLADTYSVLPFFGSNPAEDFPKSSMAARKALQLDPTLAHPHAVLGSNEMGYNWDFAGGEAEFKKAIELDPNDATAHQWYAEALGMIGGREQDALAEINRAHLLEPMSLVIRRVIGSVDVAARRYDEAIAVCKQLSEENPTYSLAHDCLGYAYWGKRMYPQVVEEWKTWGRLSGNSDEAEFGEALDRGFRSAGWRGALTEGIIVMQQQRKTSYASPCKIARLYADLGDKEQAFEWLETAYREHDLLLRELNTGYQLDSLRSDPRFADLVNKVGLPKITSP